MASQLIAADCLAALRDLPNASVDAVVSDPPYDLTGSGKGGFMGKAWDGTGVAFDPQTWRLVLRVLKPGGHLLAFGGTRTYHRLACAIEDAGFEIRDSIHWVYGSGFPKSLNLSGERQGWGTALKPAHEPIVVARKPLAGTVAQTVLAHGTGALNIDGCRVGTDTVAIHHAPKGTLAGGEQGRGSVREDDGTIAYRESVGRWPPNFLLTHAEECEEVGTTTVKASGAYPAQRGEGVATGFGKGQPDPRGPRRSGNGDGTETIAVWNCVEGCPVREMDAQSGTLRPATSRTDTVSQGMFAGGRAGVVYPDTGGASRFFPAFRYQAKASRRERNAGLEGMPERANASSHYGTKRVNLTRKDQGENRVLPTQNHHPTVKPVELMRWLCRLVTPPGGVVLDPFTGSGTTGVAAVMEGFDFIGIEREPEYAEIAERRIAHAQDSEPTLFQSVH